MVTRRIALLGGPSAGKSTLAARLYAELKDKRIIAELVQEYAREHINRLGSVQNILTQYLIYEKQREKEEIIPKEVEFVITDSPTILSYIYAVHYANISLVDHRELIIDLYRKTVMDGINRYNYIYYLSSTRPYVLDGTRQQSEQEARDIGESIKCFLTLHRIPYKMLCMPETDLRLKTIMDDLGKYIA